VIAARHIVELIAKISVAVIEVAMEQQLGERNGKNDCHASSKEGLPIAQ